MACRVHRRRIAIRRKLHLSRNLTKSKSLSGKGKKSSIAMDAFLQFHKLRLQVQAIKKECQNLMDHIQEVKVENLGKDYLVVRVACNKGQELLVSILEVFEEMNLNVAQADISCKHFFAMEAIVKADMDATVLNQALLKVVQSQTKKCTD